MLNKQLTGKWSALAELTICPSYMKPKSDAAIASKCLLFLFVTIINLPVHSVFCKYSFTQASPGLPSCKLIMVTKLL